MTDFETIIIGNGPIGSATALYLSKLGERVAVIGQTEPTDPATHDGVFASHYDQRRLAHAAGRSGPWMEAKKQAIAEFSKLETDSGVSFYDPVGYLKAIPPHLIDAGEEERGYLTQLGVPHTYYAAGDKAWRDHFPNYDFPSSHAILYEHAPAGAIDPRRLCKAQNIVAQASGAMIISALVTDVRENQGLLQVYTRSGARYTAQKVLLATGAFTNCYSLLPQPLALMPKTETVIWGEVSEAAGERLSQLPTVGYEIDDPQIMEAYMTPAAQHADGRYRVKLGANSIFDQFGDKLEAMQAWFRSGDSDQLLPALRRALTSVMPDTDFLSFETKRCIITRTATTYPMIDQVAERLFVAVGGNGGSAQCASSWGRIAADLVHFGRWSSRFPQALFRAGYK